MRDGKIVAEFQVDRADSGWITLPAGVTEVRVGDTIAIIL